MIEVVREVPAVLHHYTCPFCAEVVTSGHPRNQEYLTAHLTAKHPRRWRVALERGAELLPKK